ncbi:MAG: tRNA (adenosine(37)-N6)-threonylcarbamoyltransferase complex dimerization subunit type 1 TsaB [Lachnospiraceae bacterium]|nr:tRNA (adenosine(37)-N6)-threonylcarbamoyltransferase complex dimerization subunit type 1 TsaB [Lachnospiraceae bacterium]
MKILAIDSSGQVASVALAEDDTLIAEYTVDYKKTHSQTLLPMLDEIKKMTELDLPSVDAIAISNGPGSFTGLRIGSASAKGLGLALNKPLIEVSTIEALAYNLYGMNEAICPIMDARRDQVYTGVFTFNKTGQSPYSYEFITLVEPVPLDISELISKLNDMGRDVIFTGDGIDVYKEVIAKELKVPYSYAAFTGNRQKAGSVALLAMAKASKGEFVSADDSAPVYLRLSQAERERLEKDK